MASSSCHGWTFSWIYGIVLIASRGCITASRIPDRPRTHQQSAALLQTSSELRGGFSTTATEFVQAFDSDPCLAPPCFADSKVWGPPTWFFLHSMALSQPEQIPKEQQDRLVNFFAHELNFLLPCPSCGTHLVQHLKELPPVSTVAQSGRTALFNWTVDLHNLVNRDTNKTIMPHEAALTLYASAFNGSLSPLRAGLGAPPTLAQTGPALIGTKPQAQGKAGFLAATASECTFDHAIFDGVLRQFSRPPKESQGSPRVLSARFDFKAALEDTTALKTLEQYAHDLGAADDKCLSHGGKLAFWVNAYNALILKLVLDESKGSNTLPQSVRDLGRDGESVWERQAGKVAGKTMTLGEVLDSASKLGDPRIHFAVNCASLSCPDLRSRAYTADGIDSQLNEQLQLFVKNPTKGVRRKGKQGQDVLVSQIFQFHESDFDDVDGFIGKAMETAVHVVDYLPYNWNLIGP